MSNKKNSNRSTLSGQSKFTEYIRKHWAEDNTTPPKTSPAAQYAQARRQAVSDLFPNQLLVIPAGAAQVRSNDTFYRYRPSTAFAWLTGWGSQTVPGAVLVIDTATQPHQAKLFFKPPAGRDNDEFYSDPDVGEFWIGRQPRLHEVEALLQLPCQNISELDVPNSAIRYAEGQEGEQLDQAISELRMIKDDWEIEQMRQAVAATKLGFDQVIEGLPAAKKLPNGERYVEGVFYTAARCYGYETGYGSIVAAGANACVLHWTSNHGQIRDGELLLLDAGVEVDSLYTADITRTIPISGSYSPVQRKVYEAVLEAADAAFAIVRPGITFKQIHETAIEVIARRTAEWGLLPCSAEESLQPENGYHRRYMVHGTSHHLGIDVHDCAAARRETYHEGTVKAGMIFTIEPGLYFHTDDLTVPEELRGIGVRVEDDILVTETGAINLSAGIPRTPKEIEEWVEKM